MLSGRVPRPAVRAVHAGSVACASGVLSRMLGERQRLLGHRFCGAVGVLGVHGSLGVRVVCVVIGGVPGRGLLWGAVRRSRVRRVGSQNGRAYVCTLLTCTSCMSTSAYI